MLKHVQDITFYKKQTCNMPFEESVKKYASVSESRKVKLVDVCRTRWVERIEGLDTFQELFIPLYHTLDIMADNSDG